MRIHTICTKHGTTALVGPGTLLDELECVVCVRIADEAHAASQYPCCSRANIDCCGHGDDFQDPPALFVEIASPNYCDRDHAAEQEVPF
jgi:hypothetical protein